MDKKTKRQREIISSYIKSEENQYKTADKLKISQSSVNKALIGSGFYSYQNGIETVSNFLSGIKGEQYV
ncbi:hypothetical protein [Alkalibaculum bacchi]|uniref:hypothetical protein n=1 Tax=Alkalibaculum bacchi TaxID=645887 RepID=UPI000DE9BF92|nr:hypothetical protein [Alkalibaculum bacchi]